MIVGVSDYADKTISALPGAATESEELHTLLQAEQIGSFDNVSLAINPNCAQSIQAINSLFVDKQSDDLLLLHIASHMVRTADGSLHFLLSDSQLSDPGPTGMSADWLRRQIARCHCARIIILIDGSCPGGPPTLVVKDDDSGQRYLPAAIPAFPPFGRALIASEQSITAIGAIGRRDVGSGGFTGTVCRGLASGAADVDGDGDVTVRDLYEYLKDELVLCTPSQTPLLQTDSLESGGLLVARNPKLAPAIPVVAALPVEIRRLLRGSAGDRLRSLEMLSDLAHEGDPPQRRAALLALHELTRDDSRRVSNGASSIIVPWADLGAGDSLVERSHRSVLSGSSPMYVFISDSEVHMSQGGWNWAGGDQAGGDINKQTAGRDIAGASAGRDNVSSGLAAGISIESVSDLKDAIRALTDEVNLAAMDIADKVEALTALQWFEGHVADAEEPAETAEQVGKLKSVGGWVWNRFSSIMHELPSAGIAAWLYEAARHLIIN